MKICKFCNKPFYFTKSNKTKIYCSKKCYTKSQIKRETRICIQCNEEYIVKPASKKKYCSNKCRTKGSITRKEKHCLYCNSKFFTYISREKSNRGKYCSKECADIHKDKSVIRICKNCGKSFKFKESALKHGKTGEFCSTVCRGKINRGENHPDFKGDKSNRAIRKRFHMSQEWLDVRQEVYKRDNYKCVHCGKGMNEGKRSHHCHHIIPFVQELTRLELSNLILLCYECHQGFVHSKKNKQKLYLASAVNLKNEEI